MTKKVFRETFATRRMEVPHFTHPEFIGGEPRGERKRRLKAGDTLFLSWEDAVSAQRRDLRFVIVGLIVAIALGALIE